MVPWAMMSKKREPVCKCREGQDGAAVSERGAAMGGAETG